MPLLKQHLRLDVVFGFFLYSISFGAFSTNIKMGGKLSINGIYTVKATYLDQRTQTTFQFTRAE